MSRPFRQSTTGDLRLCSGAAGTKSTTKDSKYEMHSLRHVAASPWIDLGYNPKRVQALMEHSTIAMTLDTYTHLWQGKGCVDATKNAT